MNDFQQYINFIFQPEDIAEMRLINKHTGHISQEWHFAKELPTHLDEWQRFNERGYNIYIGVNPRKEFNKSGDENVLLARFFFADFDNITPGDGCGIWEFVSEIIYKADIEMPDMSVFSGHGIHCYWHLKEPLNNLGRWRKIQSGLIRKLNSDKTIKNPERIMRMPGFMNMKKKPVDCFIL